MLERPDLTELPAEVSAYIAALEAELEALRQGGDGADSRNEAVLEPSEPPTTMNLVTISQQGMIKRTPRHLYLRQRRGGMGVFDLDTEERDPPAMLVVADQNDGVIVVTNHARAFRVPLQELAESPIHSRGRPLTDFFPLRADERFTLAVADSGGAYLALISERGNTRRIGSQYLGKNLQPGTVLYNTKEGGAPAAACWSSGNDELLIITRTGQGIRFAERLVPVRGCLGMRVDPNDAVIAVAATGADGGVFLLSADGKGTIRLLSGFSANKSPGSGGKTVMKADSIVGAVAVDEQTDLFAISRLGKIIRFQAAEVPPKEGVVQGVNCMNLRADECVALVGCVVG